MNDQPKSRFKDGLTGILMLPILAFGAGWANPEKLPLLSHLLGAETRQFITFPLFTVGKLPITLAFLVKSCIFLTLLFFMSSRIRAMSYAIITRHTAIGRQHGYILARFASLAVFAIDLTIGLESVGP